MSEPQLTLFPEPFRVLVTGWRFWPRAKDHVVYNQLTYVHHELVAPSQTMIVVDGACPYLGVDQYAFEWASSHGTQVKPERYPAKWARLGNAAGPIRNQQMVNLGADICLAFPETRLVQPKKSGTHRCLEMAEKAGIPTRIFPFEELSH